MEDEIENFVFDRDQSSRDRISQLRDIKNDICEIKDKIFKRMDSIEKMINDHAIGVQNVYNEFKKINDFNDIGNIDSQMLIKGILK